MSDERGTTPGGGRGRTGTSSPPWQGASNFVVSNLRQTGFLSWISLSTARLHKASTPCLGGAPHTKHALPSTPLQAHRIHIHLPRCTPDRRRRLLASPNAAVAGLWGEPRSPWPCDTSPHAEEHVWHGRGHRPTRRRRTWTEEDRTPTLTPFGPACRRTASPNDCNSLAAACRGSSGAHDARTLVCCTPLGRGTGGQAGRRLGKRRRPGQGVCRACRHAQSAQRLPGLPRSQRRGPRRA